MEKSNRNIAILYFSRNKKAEATSKQWLKGSESKNYAIAASLTRLSSRVLERTGLPIYHYHEGNQIGSTFGEKLGNAFDDLFRSGYQGVIAVGNDSPELGSIDFFEVSKHLIQGNCVLGPSLRGGTYLIGLTKSSFDKLEFQELPWQKKELYASLHESLLSKECTVQKLKPLRDVNSFHDVLTLLKASVPLSPLTRFLKVLVSSSHSKYQQIAFVLRACISSIRLLRAPPLNYSHIF